MNNFFENREKFILLLIKQRCRYATKIDSMNQDNKYLKSNVRIQKHTETKLEKQIEEEFIRSLFPPRSKWVHLGCRYNRCNLDAETRNAKRLWLTYLKYRENKSELWISNLNAFVDELQRRLCNPPFEKMKIDVYPQYKSFKFATDTANSIIECRPLCSFQLRDRIILSYLNYYLTSLFDNDFFNCSYAFRIPPKNDDMYPHIRAIKDLQLYRKNHENVMLYVAECDIKKFFDTISHSIIRDRLLKLLNKHNEICDCVKTIIIKWFNRYLDSYNFYDNVFIPSKEHPQNDDFWNSARIEAKKNGQNGICQINWVDELLQNEQCLSERYGIPQGGALSTLIANIVLNEVDERVKLFIDGKDMIYIRFCDDMILVGVDKESVINTFCVYSKALQESRLFTHPSNGDVEISYKNFWECKTRNTYKWGNPIVDKKAFPWVTFVGFDCNWDGNLRIRRSTLKKQIKKQHRIVLDILGRPNVTLLCPHESTIGYIENKLIAMSVGRINRHNYLHNPHIHSWMRAFMILDENKWAIWQMRHLDMCRMNTIHKARKMIANKKEGNKRPLSGKQFESGVFHGKMFSYYGQCFTYR